MDYNRTGAVVGGLASAIAFHFGTGLEPLWLLAWVAPFPVLAVACRSSSRRAAVVAFAASILGHFYLWTFLRGTLHVPPVVVATAIVAPAFAFMVTVLVFRALVRRGAPWAAAPSVPVMWVTFEFLVARMSPHGTFGDLAYSQADVLPLVQLASLTGLWGVTFLVMAVPAAAAVATCGSLTPRSRRGIVLATALAVVGALAFGAWRLTRPGEGDTITVGLAASDVAVRRFNTRDRREALSAVEAFVGAIDDLAARGAHVVVLPEKLVGVTADYRADVERILADAAARNRVVVIGGLNEISTPKRNVALVFGVDGTITGSYLKHHHIPGLEDGYSIGETELLVSRAGAPWGVAICKDLDFPALGRRYASLGVGLMLVPAWDFVVDAWYHERMAAVRAVESGFALARSARQGLLTLRDDRGRLLAVTRSDAAPVATVTGMVKVRHDATVYARSGDWFAWLNVMATVAVLGRLVRGKA